MALTDRELKILKTFAAADVYVDQLGEETVKETIAMREPELKGSMTEDEFMQWCVDNVLPQTDREGPAPIGYTSWDEFDAAEYQRTRAAAYPSIQEQLDMQYWDSVNGTTTWADAIAQVKADNPKPE